MKKLLLVFTLILSVMSLYGAPEQNQQPAAQPQAVQAQPQTAQPKTVIAKSYGFAEELIELPIKPFEVQKLADVDLMNIDPQALKVYEAAVNTEKWPEILKTPANAIKAWKDVLKINQKNPFLNTAKARLEEWKKCIELFNAHKENTGKLKTLLASSILADEQKKGLLLKHLDSFGITFGTLEIFELSKNAQGLSAALKAEDFQAKIKAVKQARCEKNSGRDCYECGKDYAQTGEEKLMLFTKSCDLKYQPGCDETRKIKAAQDDEKARVAAEKKRKEEEFATKTYNLTEEPLDLIKPFVLGNVSEQDILNTDPAVLKKFEAAVAKEKEKDCVRTPGAMTVMWEEIAGISEKNPFQETAKTRGAEWRTCAEKMAKHENSLNLIKKSIPENSVPAEQKISLSLKHLSEYSLIFGALEIENAVIYSNEIANNEIMKTKIKEVRKQRCDLNSALDCQTYGLKHAANDEEKAAYLKKACDLGRKAACSGEQAAAAESAMAANTQPQVIEQPKEPEKPKELTEEEKFKKELNDAGRRTRMIAGTTTLVAGVVIGALGGVSFYGMSKAKKDRDKYLDAYGYSTTQEEMNYFRTKTNDADKKRKTYLGLGIAGIGVGVALIATGITFYCIEFEGEKEVKKKYNVSFGASPMDGTLQFALNW